MVKLGGTMLKGVFRGIWAGETQNWGPRMVLLHVPRRGIMSQGNEVEILLTSE